MAMGITLAENRLDLLGDRLFSRIAVRRIERDALGPAHRHPRRHRASVAGVDRGQPSGVGRHDTARPCR